MLKKRRKVDEGTTTNLWENMEKPNCPYWHMGKYKNMENEKIENYENMEK